MPQTADVFVSYSRENKDEVLAIARELQAAGVSLWIDQSGIDAATLWGEEIVNAIDQCKVLLLMLSEAAIKSQNVVREVMLVNEKKKQILPVHLAPVVVPATLKYPLAGIQHVTYFEGNKADNIQAILRALQRHGVEFAVAPQAVGQVPSPLQGRGQGEGHSMHSAQSVELERAIAVLPFHNISPDKETDYFSDGLSEELITCLARLKDIRVVPGTATMPYKGTQKSIGTIGEELRARYVITGSVRKHMDNVRIAAQLLDAQTEALLWAEAYKGKLEDIFEIQENVAKQIFDALSIKLTMVQEIALTKRSTDNAEALDYYMRGREFRYKTRRKNIDFAIELFQKAIELDTRYANAYAGLSEAYSGLYDLYGRNPADLSRCAEASLKAIMYDSSSAEAHAALGLTYFYQGQLQEAVQACLKAIELDPNLFMGYRNLGRIYHLTDRDAEAAHMMEKGIELKPDDYTVMGILAGILVRLGRSAEWDDWQRRLLELLPRHLLRDPEDIHARLFYAGTLARASRRDEALTQARMVLAAESTDGVTLYNVSCIFSLLGDLDHAVESLRNSIAAGHDNYDWIKRDSDLDPIRNHPGYIELMKDK
jgi:TolB-like protein/cytochrome c-type biogenesis protein CcmH/NrfG